jgi:hypothetical protein
VMPQSDQNRPADLLVSMKHLATVTASESTGFTDLITLTADHMVLLGMLS